MCNTHSLTQTQGPQHQPQSMTMCLCHSQKKYICKLAYITDALYIVINAQKVAGRSTSSLYSGAKNILPGDDVMLQRV